MATYVCLDFGIADELHGHHNLLSTTPIRRRRRDRVRRLTVLVRVAGLSLGCSTTLRLRWALWWAVKRCGSESHADDLIAEIREYRGTLTQPAKIARIATGRWKRT
jgi:hypothetical protein